MTTPWERQRAELAAKYGTADVVEALKLEAAEDPEWQKEKKMAEEQATVGVDPSEVCKEPGCDKPKRQGKARCDEHQKAYQNAAYRRAKEKVKEAQARREPAATKPQADPRPAPEGHGPVEAIGNIGNGQIAIKAGVLDMSEIMIVLHRLPAGATQGVVTAALYGYLVGKGLAA